MMYRQNLSVQRLSVRIRSLAVAALFLCLGGVLHAKDISVRFSGVTVEQALETLKNSEGLSFVFKTSDVDLDAKVNAEFDRTPLETVLETIFKGQPLRFEIDGNMVHIVRVRKGSPAAEKGTGILVRGKVTDMSGEPLVGVGVLIRGTAKGVVSDIDGNYAIEASPGDVLQFSSLGFEMREMTVGKNTSMDVSLSEEVNGLDEVVVIGYGEMKKSDLTGAVASVKPDDLPMSSNTSIAHMLSGRAAGVSATQTSAQPGGGVEILVRGATSTGAGNEPLYIIDGFPISSGGGRACQ